MIDTPYDLDAVRALDDPALAQLLELIDTFGPRVATVWLARWRNGGIDATTETPPVRQTLTGSVCVSTGQRHGQIGASTAPISHASGLNARGMSMTNPSIARIQAACCAHYGVGIADLLSARQEQRIVQPRHIAIWLCRRLTNHSMAHIGRRFGNRDHSSIYRAMRRANALVAVKGGDAWRLLAELQVQTPTVWPQITVAHGWVTAAIKTRKEAA